MRKIKTAGHDLATLVPAHEAVTAERIERAIAVTAYVMQQHNLPQLLPSLKRLEAERDRLCRDGDPIEYAKRVLDRSAIDVQQKRLVEPH